MSTERENEVEYDTRILSGCTEYVGMHKYALFFGALSYENKTLGVGSDCSYNTVCARTRSCREAKPKEELDLPPEYAGQTQCFRENSQTKSREPVSFVDGDLGEPDIRPVSSAVSAGVLGG